MGNRNYKKDDENGCYGAAVAVTPNDTTDLGITRGLYVSVAGALSVMMADGNVVVFPTAVAGYHPLQVQRVRTTGTAATGIVALY
jgi:hypothetical protein